MSDATRAILEFAPARVEVENLPGGGCILRSPVKLEPYAPNICEYLTDWAEKTPDRTFLAERDGEGGWRRIRYGEALAFVRSIAQALLDRGMTPDRPVMILSDNSIDNGMRSSAPCMWAYRWCRPRRPIR